MYCSMPNYYRLGFVNKLLSAQPNREHKKRYKMLHRLRGQERDLRKKEMMVNISLLFLLKKDNDYIYEHLRLVHQTIQVTNNDEQI
jgi:hypothetical protein